MPAGYGNLLQTVFQPDPVIDMGESQGCHAHNCVHRSADIMAHGG
jgi:hypothetical protein